jgi:hypothetical protein
VLFAVILNRGSAWDASQPLEGQVEWEPHRVFMNALEQAGFVALGGPLEGTNEVLLICRAASPEEIADRLAPDPWHKMGLLQINRITPWQLRLGRI